MLCPTCHESFFLTPARVHRHCAYCGKGFITYLIYVKRGQMECCSQPCRGAWIRRPEAERFWAQVDRRGPDECWPWLGATQKQGYGVFPAFIDATQTKRHNRMAHVYAWETVNGPMPEGKQGNHHCDNPPCCNFSHVYAGTKAQNTADAMARGRMKMLLTTEQTRGEGNSHAKITEADVRAIRASHNSANTLALTYGISESNVRSIRNRRSWKHVK